MSEYTEGFVKLIDVSDYAGLEEALGVRFPCKIQTLMDAQWEPTADKLYYIAASDLVAVGCYAQGMDYPFYPSEVEVVS